jgi:hypothetical protein
MMTNSRHNFNQIAKGQPRKREAPFSLRLTFEERARLEAAAGGEPLGAYIKAVLFAGEPPRLRRRGGAPVHDQKALARVLAALGQARLSSNLNQLARAVNTGTLPVHPEIEDELRGACADIAKMRAELITALGLKGGSQ